MKRITQSLRLILAAALVTSLGACSSLQKKNEYAGVDDGDFVTGSPLPDRNEGSSFYGASTDRNQFAPVHFAFDSYDISSSETHKLEQVASYMKSSSSGELIIAGFTDERGTAEYNRGLGERRAQAVRSYLISLGVNPDRMQTTSFGAEMPVDPGHNEEAWAKNRRAEFGVVH